MEIASAFIIAILKAVFLGVLAYAGIKLGKRYRDYKDKKKA